MKRDNDELSEQAKISITMRRDLEHRLKGQIDQTLKLQVKCEEQEKEIGDLKGKLDWSERDRDRLKGILQEKRAAAAQHD